MRVLFSSICLVSSPVLERNLPEILVNDTIMTCSSLVDIDKWTFLRQFLFVPSAIAETISIFLRISYPPLKALKKPVIRPERKVKLSVTLFLRGLISNLLLQTKFYSSLRRSLAPKHLLVLTAICLAISPAFLFDKGSVGFSHFAVGSLLILGFFLILAAAVVGG